MSKNMWMTTRQNVWDNMDKSDWTPIEPQEEGVWLLHSTTANDRYIYWTWERRTPTLTPSVNTTVLGEK